MNDFQTKQEQHAYLAGRIKSGLDTLDVSYGEEAIDKLVVFMELLAEWNKTHNLTAVDDLEEMLSVHIFDCASIRPYVKGASLLDVGSGAGLPGMILAILSPALAVTSVEARNKKAQFQMYAANKLQLKNFTVENVRIEDFHPKEKFGMITARAFSSIENFVNGSRGAIAPNGRWLAMKGVVPKEELKVLKKLNLKFDTFALKVPELDAQRNLIVISAPK
ncbi:16S rRNA (guanine(527)-N(7))-methyltransferase RsmG [Arenicella xantha]|uniref:Ribosomal RNA small subunit methyltransferase G n=1 Tax=Arenicella xantha TaxID=644221 RepID=A0A395JQX9_9GAMM|nr:16S rRNA (guanine(527)-N(7))-methyltransferase RsmG [Arenicella xantha]RBP53773.1 16S rRNA m(7)G-527 methyltransferase [Arenicella xantha]